MINVLELKSRHSSLPQKDEPLLAKAKKGLRASLSFLCLLGITWIFGAVAIGRASVPFFYLFAICNVLQGVVIFVFQVLLNVK